MSVEESIVPRTSVLGGQSRDRHTFGRISGPAMGVLAGLAALWVAAIIWTKSWLVILLGVVLGGFLVAAMMRVTDEGDGWTRTVLYHLRYGLQTTRRLRRGDAGLRFWRWSRVPAPPLWSPQVGAVPRPIGRLREIEAPLPSGAAFSLLHHPSGRGWQQGHFSAIVEVIGGGDGIRPVGEVNARGERFGQILKSLASPEVAVSQIDPEMRVTPADPGAYREHVNSLLVDNPQWWDKGRRRELLGSMRQLGELGSGASETYRSYVTVRLPVDAVQRRNFGPDPGLAAVVDTATEALRLTVERFQNADYEVRNVLTPRRVGALIRNSYVPSWSPDDLGGLETVCDAFAFFGYDHGPAGRSLRVDAGDHGEWWHAIASVPLDGWPTAEVTSRWLEDLVTNTSSAIIRTIKTQHSLLSRREAIQRGQLALTLDEADEISERKKGKTSTGETELQASAARRLLGDVVGAGAAGDRPALRLMVSAPTRLGLEEARSVMSAAADDAKINRLHWYDRRHDLAMVTMLPFARGLVKL